MAYRRMMNSRVFLGRVANFVRPKPRMIPLTVEQVMASSRGQGVVDQFNNLYYAGGVAPTLSWRGAEMIKNPCDVWMMVELLQRLRPRVLIETGTHYGASATFFADMTRTLGIDCKVVTIDFNPKWKTDPTQLGIESLAGYTTDAPILRRVREIVDSRPGGHVLVTLDASHAADPCFEEIQLYSPFVTKDSYLVVEDSNVNGHPSFASHGPGPWEATERFLQSNKDFVVDLECQRFLLTFNPNGWLRRVR